MTAAVVLSESLADATRSASLTHLAVLVTDRSNEWWSGRFKGVLHPFMARCGSEAGVPPLLSD